MLKHSPTNRELAEQLANLATMILYNREAKRPDQKQIESLANQFKAETLVLNGYKQPRPIDQRRDREGKTYIDNGQGDRIAEDNRRIAEWRHERIRESHDFRHPALEF